MIAVFITNIKACQQDDYSVQHKIGYQLLGCALKEIFKITVPLAKLMMQTNAYGKPYLVNFPWIHFSISHNKTNVVCSISNHEVGVDVENYQRVTNHLIDRVLTPVEINRLKELSPDDPAFAVLFNQYWTLKESYMKWRGKGLSIDPKRISFNSNLLNGDKIVSSDRQAKFFQFVLRNQSVLSVCCSAAEQESPKIRVVD